MRFSKDQISICDLCFMTILIKYLKYFISFIFYSLEVVLVSGRSLHMSYG